MDNAFTAYRSAPSKPPAAKANEDFDDAIREANAQREMLAELGTGNDFNDNIDLTLSQSDDTALFKNRLQLTNDLDMDSEFDQAKTSQQALANDGDSPFARNRVNLLISLAHSRPHTLHQHI